MPSIAEAALQHALDRGLDLSVHYTAIPTAPFVFRCLSPRQGILQAFQRAKRQGDLWPPGMPVPVVTYSPRHKEWQIMDGMNRICAAQMEGFEEIPAFVASGDTHDELHRLILHKGYFGEDFIEMLALVSPEIRENLHRRDDLRLSGK